MSLILLLAVSQSDPRLVEDRGWPSGTLRDQLDRDSTLIPFGKGALFVPAMNDPLDEPTVTVYQGGRLVEEATTGERIILTPGTYEIRLGSGADQQRIKVQASVREQHTTILPVSWSGLAVHIVDEQYGSLRGSYELIRADDREYIGIGFGTDEQAGEPVSTWILKPGLYKIVRVGENYRARRDFATVRLVEGELTHFLLVINADTGEFAGGGEIPEEEVFRPRDGFFGSLVIGGDASMNARNNVLGLADGLSFTLRGFADGRLSFEIFDNPLLLTLQVEEGQTKSPELPWSTSNDRADLDALYVYRLTNWLGPYGRLGAETNFFARREQLEAPTDVVLIRDDNTIFKSQIGIERVKLSPSFGLVTLKEGAGIHVRVFKAIFAETTLRTGIGARHRLTRDLYELEDDDATSAREYREVVSTNQVGVEGTLLASARITRFVIVNLELDTLMPFDGVKSMVLELEGSVALKLTSYASINYRLRFLRDRALSERDVIQQDVLLRLSLEIF